MGGLQGLARRGEVRIPSREEAEAEEEVVAAGSQGQGKSSATTC